MGAIDPTLLPQVTFAFCPEHLTVLRQEMDSLGLTKFVSANQEELQLRITAGFEGDYVKAFDPLLLCSMAIVEQVMSRISNVKDITTPCPFCLVASKAGPEMATQWVEDGMNFIFKGAVDLGLVQMGQA